MARRRHKATAGDRHAATPAPVAERPPVTSRPPVPARRVVVIGAGADVAYGIPTVANLMYELGDFARGEGARVHDLLKHKIKSLRFTFDKVRRGAQSRRSHTTLRRPGGNGTQTA